MWLDAMITRTGVVNKRMVYAWQASDLCLAICSTFHALLIIMDITVKRYITELTQLLGILPAWEEILLGDLNLFFSQRFISLACNVFGVSRKVVLGFKEYLTRTRTTHDE